MNQTVAHDKLPKWFNEAVEKNSQEGLAIIHSYFRYSIVNRELSQLLMNIDVEKYDAKTLIALGMSSDINLDGRKEFCNRAYIFLKENDNLSDLTLSIFRKYR